MMRWRKTPFLLQNFQKKPHTLQNHTKRVPTDSNVFGCYIMLTNLRESMFKKTKTKTAISISKLMKLRLGDTFRFVTAHNERHLLQAENVLKDINIDNFK